MCGAVILATGPYTLSAVLLVLAGSSALALLLTEWSAARTRKIWYNPDLTTRTKLETVEYTSATGTSLKVRRWIFIIATIGCVVAAGVAAVVVLIR